MRVTYVLGCALLGAFIGLTVIVILGLGLAKMSARRERAARLGWLEEQRRRDRDAVLDAVFADPDQAGPRLLP